MDIGRGEPGGAVWKGEQWKKEVGLFACAGPNETGLAWMGLETWNLPNEWKSAPAMSCPALVLPPVRWQRLPGTSTFHEWRGEGAHLRFYWSVHVSDGDQCLPALPDAPRGVGVWASGQGDPSSLIHVYRPSGGPRRPG